MLPRIILSTCFQLFKNVKTVLRLSAAQKLEESGIWLWLIISLLK